MIPTKLNLSNFTSYGISVPTLDLTKFHMAAISGQNGAGKSSLLDSITWCLWGTSRLGDNSDQLIRLGAEVMEVELTFLLDTHEFTVKRKRSLKSGGQTSLEFFSGLHNLTEGTIKTTQQKIIDTLHLTFETFVNSAFIRQGHADEFTTKGPTERKRILADILGLSHYEKLEEKAKEKVKELQNGLKLKEYQLLEIEAELSQKEEREKALSKAEEEAKIAEAKLKDVEQLIKTIGLEKENLNLKMKSLQESKERIQGAEKELLDLKTQISLKEQSLEDYRNILSKQAEIEENYQNFKNYQERSKALEAKRTELIKIKDELVMLQKIITERDTKRNTAITALKIDKQKIETENQQLTEQNSKLTKNKDLCPTCGQLIGLETNKAILSQNQETITANQKRVTEVEDRIKHYMSVIFPQVAEAEEKEIKIKALEEDTRDYKQVFEQITLLSKYETLNLKLQQAKTVVSTQEETITDLKKIYSLKEEQISKEQQGLEKLDIYEKQMEEAEVKLQTEEQNKQELSQKTLALRGKVGEAKQLVSRVKQLDKLLVEKKEEKNKLTSDKEAFEELTLAFGKKGIQAMIIETAIPEIEDETNRLLDRLTEGRMKVALETQRETKTKVGGEKVIVETLDIVISDEMGARPYESYSGGEAFRVNFAIRLALSKLLTHRAGSKLQFLVIDEGFGTQDAEGRSRIVEAINTIKNDFAKILVITHLEELKEEFPVRIEVQKGSTGSTFEIVGV